MHRSARRVLISLVVVLVSGIGASLGAVEMHIIPVISPGERPLRLYHVFHEYPLGNNDMPNHDIINEGTIFNENAALIPVWQLRTLLPEAGRTTPITAVVGRAALFLPPEITDTLEKALALGALKELRRQLPDEKTRLEVGFHRIPAVLHGAEIISLTPLRSVGASSGALNSCPESGDLRFMCTARKNGRTVEAVVSGYVSVLVPQPVAVEDISRDEEIDSSKIGLHAVPVGKVSREIRIDPEGSYIAVRPVEAGEVLTLRNTRVKNNIEVGDRVKVGISRGMVSLRMTGTARESGRIGDLVTVRLSSGVLKDCRVRKDGEVTID